MFCGNAYTLIRTGSGQEKQMDELLTHVENYYKIEDGGDPIWYQPTEILTYPHEVLSEPCDICTSDPESILIKLEEALWDKEIETYRGVGLAANQIGISQRIAIIRFGELRIDLINPEVVDHSDETFGSTESCLSIPNVETTVRRWRSVVLQASNYSKPLVINNEDVSRIIQHEVDHLDGVTILDYKKVGRNDKCPCGSGNKYKKCCGGKQ